MAQSADARLKATQVQEKALSGGVTAPPEDPPEDLALILTRRRPRAKSPAVESALLQAQIEQLTIEKAKMQTRIIHLLGDLDMLTQECDYVSNAYNGLKSKHDQLTAERLNYNGRVNELLHELEFSNETVAMEKTSRERAEQEALALRGKISRAQNAMAD